MPTLNYEIPRSQWAILEEEARREGVSVRALILWRLKAEFPYLGKPPTPPGPDEQAA